MDDNQMLYEEQGKAAVAQTKWAKLLDYEGPGVAAIRDDRARNGVWNRRSVTAMVLENTVREMRSAARLGLRQGLITEDVGLEPIPANFMGASSSTAGTGGVDTFDPV